MALAACSPAGEREDAVEPEEAATPAPPSTSARPALLPEDIEGAALNGELGCSFNEGASGSPLLVAMADVRDEARAEGVLRIGLSTVRLRAEETGGFNALIDGERFTSGDLTATVAVVSSAPLGEGESPPRAATLTLTSDPLPPQRIEGRWTCGP